jgi:hypothetical protein
MAQSPGLPRFAATLGTWLWERPNPNGVMTGFRTGNRHNPGGVAVYRFLSQGSREARATLGSMPQPLRGTVAQNPDLIGPY